MWLLALKELKSIITVLSYIGWPVLNNKIINLWFYFEWWLAYVRFRRLNGLSGGCLSLWGVMGCSAAIAPHKGRRATTHHSIYSTKEEELVCERRWMKEERRQLSNEINGINWMEQCRNLSLPEWMKRRTNEPKARRQANLSSNLFFLCEEEKKMKGRREGVGCFFLLWVKGGSCRTAPQKRENSNKQPPQPTSFSFN